MRMWVGAGCYVLASVALGVWGHGTSPWRFAWVVLPILAIAWMALAIVLRIRQMDEYQVKLFFPGLAVGFTVAMVTALGLGTLGSAGVDLPSGGWIVAIAGILSWELVNLLTRAPMA